MKKYFRPFSFLTGMFFFLFLFFGMGTFFATRYGANSLNALFGIETTKIIGQTENKKFESKWANPNSKGFFNENKRIIREAASEGMVLLWNENETLPLDKKSRISAFGHASVDISECGTGSSEVNTVTANGRDVSNRLYDALNRYFLVNDALYDFYDFKEGSSYRMEREEYRSSGPGKVNEVPMDVYTQEVKDSYSQFKDCALIFLSRTGGENGDLIQSKENQVDEGGYLTLTKEEKDLLSFVTTSPIFEKVVLVLNTANPIMMEDLSPYIQDIDACLYMGLGGSSSVNALSEILVGNVSPSGRLSDTLVYSLFSHPSTVNQGNFTYSEINGRLKSDIYQSHYLSYSENIYVGYKYYETRYMDTYLAKERNAASLSGAIASKGNWSYEEEVAFPFGYGESYTTFSYSDFSYFYDAIKKSFTLSLKVTNTGNSSSKEVIQAYLSKPYTEYDLAHQIEKSGVELVGFVKTSLLQPGESQFVSIPVEYESFRTYDSSFDNNDSTKGRYVVEKGDYVLTVATDSHIAANNVLSFLGKENRPEVLQKGDRKVSMGKEFAFRVPLKEDVTSFMNSSLTGKRIVNKLNDMDMNLNPERGKNEVVYLSRSDWKSTYPGKQIFFLNDGLANDLRASFVTPTEGESDLPKYSSFSSFGTIPDVTKGDLVAYDFISAPLDEEDPLYDEEWEKSGINFSIR